MTTDSFIVVIAVILVAWFIYASRQLSPSEVQDFARRKRLLAIETHYSFDDSPVAVDPSFKSSMASEGELYRTDEPLTRFPSIAAGLLKWKKHEWIIFAFSREGRVIAEWMNKGPDNKKVWVFLNPDAVLKIAKQEKADTVLDFHNHPNPDPNNLSTCLPSRQDHISANHLGSQFVACGINYLAFVAERGRHYQYACWVPDRFHPLDSFLTEVGSINGTSRLANFRLRRQHRAKSRLASLLQYKDASENLGFVDRQEVIQPASSPVVVSPPKQPPEREPAPPPIPGPASQPCLTRTPVQSSFLSEVGYDPHRQILEVAFRNGSVYRYFGVPESVYSGLMTAPSKGKYFNSRVAGGGYACVQIRVENVKVDLQDGRFTETVKPPSAPNRPAVGGPFLSQAEREARREQFEERARIKGLSIGVDAFVKRFGRGSDREREQLIKFLTEQGVIAEEGDEPQRSIDIGLAENFITAILQAQNKKKESAGRLR